VKKYPARLATEIEWAEGSFDDEEAGFNVRRYVADWLADAYDMDVEPGEISLGCESKPNCWWFEINAVPGGHSNSGYINASGEIEGLY